MCCRDLFGKKLKEKGKVKVRRLMMDEDGISIFYFFEMSFFWAETFQSLKLKLKL